MLRGARASGVGFKIAWVFVCRFHFAAAALGLSPSGLWSLGIWGMSGRSSANTHTFGVGFTLNPRPLWDLGAKA